MTRDRSKEHIDKLAAEAAEWDSGKRKPTDPEWRDAPEAVPRLSPGWYVFYEVEGFKGTQRAGPYPTYADADAQRADIEGYMGVRGTRVVGVSLSTGGQE